MERIEIAQVRAIDFRRALSHYPSGVTLVAAQPVDGEPAAMVVGTFTSVSLEPPLVGFLVDRGSTTWPRIRETGRFCASVLHADDEYVCRAFAIKAEGRFDHLTAVPGSGSPRLSRAALWVDCDIDSVMPAGDHDFVLGRVRELGLGEDPGPPLIFLRGGYGAPQIASLQAEAAGMGPALDLADVVRSEIEAVAKELNLECTVTVAVNGSVVCIAAAGMGSVSSDVGSLLGASFPLAAPMAPHFVASGNEAQQRRWLAEGSRLTGTDVSELGRTLLAAVGARDCVASTGRSTSERLRSAILDTPTTEPGDSFGSVLREVVARGVDPGLTRPIDQVDDVVSLHTPVRDASGQVLLCLDLLGFRGDEPSDMLVRCRDRLLEGAARATMLLQGELPF